MFFAVGSVFVCVDNFSLSVPLTVFLLSVLFLCVLIALFFCFSRLYSLSLSLGVFLLSAIFLCVS